MFSKSFRLVRQCVDRNWDFVNVSLFLECSWWPRRIKCLRFNASLNCTILQMPFMQYSDEHSNAYWTKTTIQNYIFVIFSTNFFLSYLSIKVLYAYDVRQIEVWAFHFLYLIYFLVMFYFLFCLLSYILYALLVYLSWNIIRIAYENIDKHLYHRRSCFTYSKEFIPCAN